MSDEGLLERLIAAERRAATAEAKVAMYEARDAARRQSQAERVRRHRAKGNVQSRSVTPSNVTPPLVSSFSPTPPIITSLPPRSAFLASLEKHAPTASSGVGGVELELFENTIPSTKSAATPPRRPPAKPKAARTDPDQPPGLPWMGEVRGVLKRHYGTEPRGKFWGTVLGPLVVEHGVEAVVSELDAYCAVTEMLYLNPQRFADMFGGWRQAKVKHASRTSGTRPGMQWLDELCAKVAAEGGGEGAIA